MPVSAAVDGDRLVTVDAAGAVVERSVPAAVAAKPAISC